MLDLAVVATVFVTIFLAELPDKSLFASLVLGTRLPPLAVWVGVTAAFAVHVTIAVLAGHLLTLLPHRLVEAVVVVLFALAAAWLLLGREEAEEERGEEAAQTAGAAGTGRSGWVRAAATSFGVVFVGEWGDVTQIATANFAARTGDAWSVALGSFAALATVSALAVLLGRGLVARLDVRLVRRVAGVVMAVLALLTLVAAVRG